MPALLQHSMAVHALGLHSGADQSSAVRQSACHSFCHPLQPLSQAQVQASEGNLGEENSMYFDKELNMWREKGAPPPAPIAPLAPPPMSSAQPPGMLLQHGDLP